MGHHILQQSQFYRLVLFSNTIISDSSNKKNKNLRKRVYLFVITV